MFLCTFFMKFNTHNCVPRYFVLCNYVTNYTHLFLIKSFAFMFHMAGILREKVPGPSNPMSNPLAMMDMMKGDHSFL